MKNDLLITFPFSNWDNLFIDNTRLDITPLCVCSQMKIDENGYGVYAWSNETLGLIKYFISDLYYLDNINFKLINNDKLLMQGVSFYGDTKRVVREINDYKIKLIKEKKLGKEIKFNSPIEEYLLDGHISNSMINYFLREKYNLVYIHRYLDKAGMTLIIFNKDMINKIKGISKENIIHMSSYDDLNNW